MKILIIVDKPKTAIDKLAQMVKKYNPHFDITVFPIHPKRNDPLVFAEVYKLLVDCDLLDIHYWKSGEVLREMYPTEFKKKKKILCHFNPYDLDKKPWQNIYDKVVVGNQQMQVALPYARLIPYAVDFESVEYSDTHEAGIVNMVVGRIEGKKGVKEVAIACRELGYRFHLIGRISKPDYFKEVKEAAGEGFKFYEDVSDHELKDHYKRALVHICNSVDGFESGTLPILEAMASGTIVLTRDIGHVSDINDGKNMIVRKGQVDDIEDLKQELANIMENLDRQQKIREKALYSVKNRPAQKMARQFSSLYYDILNTQFPLVSIIIPTHNDTIEKDDEDRLIECLMSAGKSQDYPHYEVVVVDSGKQSIELFINAARKLTKVPFKYCYFNRDGYTLAEARNRGIIEAEGKILVFCDERLQMDKNAIKEFVKMSKQHCWLWGVKDDYQKAFVENFSSIRREDIIKSGMFNERIDRYGAMSEEIRKRFTQLGFAFQLVQNAHAKSMSRSKNRAQKMKDIIWAKLLLFKLYG